MNLERSLPLSPHRSALRGYRTLTASLILYPLFACELLFPPPPLNQEAVIFRRSPHCCCTLFSQCYCCLYSNSSHNTETSDKDNSKSCVYPNSFFDKCRSLSFERDVPVASKQRSQGSIRFKASPKNDALESRESARLPPTNGMQRECRRYILEMIRKEEWRAYRGFQVCENKNDSLRPFHIVNRNHKIKLPPNRKTATTVASWQHLHPYPLFDH